jgi:hypothetical protein
MRATLKVPVFTAAPPLLSAGPEAHHPLLRQPFDHHGHVSRRHRFRDELPQALNMLSIVRIDDKDYQRRGSCSSNNPGERGPIGCWLVN